MGQIFCVDLEARAQQRQEADEGATRKTWQKRYHKDKQAPRLVLLAFC